MLTIPFIFAIEVDRPEIESVGNAIEFENFTGTHTAVDTLAQIRAIGTTLAGKTGERAIYAGGRYAIIHAIDATTRTGLDADILILGPNAAVDHIRNLRHIISAYLSAQYGYSAPDAATLATFITVYNAVYRGKISDFSQKYKNVVMQYLTPEAAGLSTNYRDWPGKTQIVIPLFDPENGGLSTVDTSIISDEQVIETMREEPDMGIPAREDLADLKEREADQAEERAEVAQERTDEAKQQVVEERESLREEQAKLSDAIVEAAIERNTTGSPDPEKEAAVKEQAAVTQEQTEALKEAETEVKEAEQETQAQEKLAETKREEAANDRAEIQKDQQRIVYVLHVVDDSALLSKLAKVNIENGDVISESEIRTIRSRTIYPVKENFLAITGETPSKLALIDTANMEIIKESDETVAENAMLVSDGTYFYTVISSNNAWVLAKYDTELKLQCTSAITVAPETALTITRSVIGANSANGNIRLFKLEDLTEVQ
jgi:hypothetical protein